MSKPSVGYAFTYPKVNFFYLGMGYLGIHSSSDGEKKITLPEKLYVRGIFGCDFISTHTDEITLYMKQYETAVFELNKACESL